MSEFLNNQEYKQAVLKNIIMDLHKGKDPAQVQEEFKKLIRHVDASEIANMEQQLIQEGMNPNEITKLCDVHAAVFKDLLAENEQPQLVPGHPAYTLRHENKEAEKLLAEIDALVDKLDRQPDLLNKLKEKLNSFREIDRHFSKKENILFPYLEKHNITGPPQVMWSVDDEIRAMLKILSSKLTAPAAQEIKPAEIKGDFNPIKQKVEEMFFKEENILIPMLLDHLTEQDWAEVKEQEIEFGPVFSRPAEEFWQPKPAAATSLTKEQTFTGDNRLPLDTGALTLEEINTILTNVPIDITFVDKHDTVRYFSQGRERVFTRTKSIIGRKVQNCHPPESVHVVEKIVSDFKSGKHSSAEFWLELNGAFIHIRYFALQDSKGEYLGTMEVSQNVTGIRALQGEQRLLQYEG